MGEVIKLSIVVPVYNGSPVLPKLYETLLPVCEGIGSFEIILVDDGSNDASRKIIQELVTKDPRVIGVFLSRNFGQHNATLAGLAQSRGEFIVTLDQDIQNPQPAFHSSSKLLNEDMTWYMGSQKSADMELSGI